MKKIEITKANDSSDTLKAAQLYIENGLSVIPIKADGTKAPAISSWKPYQNKQAKHAEIAEWFRNGNGVAIVSGKVSGNLEIIDFDEPELFGPWSDLVHKAYPDLLSHLPVVQTPSGGCHIYYRCAEIENNQKLAQARTENKIKTLIETRGEGGYVLTYPSPADCHHSGKLYTMRVGDLNAIPEITINERCILLDFARSFDQTTKIIKGKTEYETAFATHLDQRSGDVFNRCADWHDILEPHGWVSWWKTSDGKRYWQRPDKEGTGISATTDYNGSNAFYVFSSNAEPFEANRSYSKFAAYTLLNHAGNYRAAAKALAIDGYGTAERYKQPNAQTALERVPMAEPIGIFDAVTDQSQFNPKLWQARLTDAGNAECMATLFGNAFKYCHTRNLWLYWDSTRWVPDQCNRTTLAAVQVARERCKAAASLEDFDARRKLVNFALASEGLGKTKSMLQMARALSPFVSTIADYDADPLLAATPNGALDLRTGEFRSSLPEDYITMQLGASYDAMAPVPRWHQFLSEVFCGDEELIRYIQKAVGYCLTGETNEQKFFLCYGVGANGKSVFLEILSKLLGDYSATASFETFDAARRSESSNDLAALKGKRLVTIIEAEEDKRLAEARVKAVTGGDAISCRFLYGEYFTYQPQFKLWMAVNHRPIIRGTDKGIWRRMQLIPFEACFIGREDRYLNKTLFAELSGILNWALEGLKLYRLEGLTIPKAVELATESYREEQDSITQWLKEECASDARASLSASDGYQNYKAWAEDRGERPFAQKRWSSQLIDKGYQRIRRNSGYFYEGLGLSRRSAISPQ